MAAVVIRLPIELFIGSRASQINLKWSTKKCQMLISYLIY